jgi:hypothetical protein
MRPTNLATAWAALTLSLSPAGAQLVSLGGCEPMASLPTQRRVITLRAVDVDLGHRVLDELVPHGATVIEMNWRETGRPSCVELLVGSELDVLAAMPMIEQFASARIGSSGMVLMTIQALPRKTTELYGPSFRNLDCASIDTADNAMLAGLNHRFDNRVPDALKCFARAVFLSNRSVPAQLGLATLSNLARLSEREVQSSYSKLVAMQPVFRSLAELETARLPFYHGRPSEAVKRLEVFLSTQAAFAHRTVAARTMSEWALVYGELRDAKLAQEYVVKGLSRAMAFQSAEALQVKSTLDYERLGLLREASKDFAGALDAYATASNASDKASYAFEPDLGRLRLRRKLGVAGKNDRSQCASWRQRIRRADFRVPDKANGGLALANARIELACGSIAMGLNSIKVTMKQRPTWDQPLLILADHLLSEGRWKQFQEVRKTAERLKGRSDIEAIDVILRELEGLPDVRE